MLAFLDVISSFKPPFFGALSPFMNQTNGVDLLGFYT